MGLDQNMLTWNVSTSNVQGCILRFTFQDFLDSLGREDFKK